MCSAPVLDSRRALALAEGAEKELLALLAALIAKPSPAGRSAAAAQKVLATWLERRGFAVERFEDDPEALGGHPEFSPPPPAAGRPVNLAARPAEVPTADTVLFAHIDTEPAGDGWTTPPHTAVRRGLRLHGLGAADDKGGLAAAAVAAALSARHLGRAPVLLSVHGKGGGARGTLPAFHRLAGEARAALYVHPPETGDGLAVFKNVSRGVVDLDLRVEGWRGPPREMNTPESARPEDSGDALAAGLALIEDVRRGPLAGAEVRLGRLEAGESPGLIPLHATAGIRVLFQGATTVSDVVTAFRRAAASFRSSHQALPFASSPRGAFRFSVEPSGLRANPARTPWDAPFTRGVRAATARITGREPSEYPHHLASDIRFPIRLAGIPCVGLGSRAGAFYAANEWIAPSDLIRLVAVLLLALTRTTRSP